MIWIILVSAVLAIAIVTGAARASRALVGSRGLGALVGLGVVTLGLAGAAIAFSAGPGSTGRMGTFSQTQLEADRQMTQQMAQTSYMGTESMLTRSVTDPAYLDALTRYTLQFDRQAGIATP